jgi:cell division protein FtsQ
MSRKLILIGIWSLLVVTLFVILGLTSDRHGNSRCREVQIKINYPAGDYFINEQDIRNYIILLGDSVKGEKLSQINIQALEEMITQNPYVSGVRVYATLDGVIKIEVSQRKPIVRVQNAINQKFYISDDGIIMPLNPGRPARVLLASGNIFEIQASDINLNIKEIKTAADSALARTALYRIYNIASYIDKNPFLKAQIEQIYLNKKGDFELIPLVGKQLIILGDANDIKEKFDNLQIFYKQGLSHEGWDKYDTINLKYRNQVVCTKIKEQ